MARRTHKSRTHQTTFRTRLTPHSKEPEGTPQGTAKKKKSRKLVRPKKGASTSESNDEPTGWESIEGDN